MKRPTTNWGQKSIPGLGPLESVLMAVLWGAEKPLVTTEIISRMDYYTDLAYSTVMTVLLNLHKKGMANRSKSAGAWFYSAATASLSDYMIHYMAMQAREFAGWTDPASIRHAMLAAVSQAQSQERAGTCRNG